ncbi:MAG: phosphate-starvation-inducible PsiE family protein [Methanoregula sp.]|uniref:phosphate-starvation-inducible PsiE family protein n=1 Tax=Methanoregula sp. TaxID=2052170 RepID=UPI003BB09FCF
MIEQIDRFERIIYTILIVLLGVVLIFALIGMVYLIISSIISPSIGLLSNTNIVSILGSFLLVLITVELLDTMKAYIADNVVHVEVVVLLAIIAIARKVILLDPASADSTELIGFGVIIVGLAAAYYLIKKAGVQIGYGFNKPPQEKHQVKE